MLRRMVLTVFVAAAALCPAPFGKASNPMGAAMSMGGLDEALVEVSMLDDAELEARATELQSQLEADPKNEDLYRQMVACAATRVTRQVEAEFIAAAETGEEVDYSEANSSYLEKTNAALSPILDQWQKNLPKSCGPLLIRAQIQQDAEQRNAILTSAVEQCPDDADVASSRAFIAVGEGDLERGRALLRDFIEDHPKAAAAYEALTLLMMFGDSQVEAMKVISAWRENLPNDLRAMQTELSYRGQQMDKTAAAAAASELLARDHSAAELLQTCQVVSSLDLPEQTEACLERVMRMAGDGDTRVALSAFGAQIENFKEQRDWDRIEELAANIPAQLDSPETRLGMALVLLEGERCAAAYELIDDLDTAKPPERFNASIWKTALASIRSKCGDAAQGTSEMLEVFRTASLDDLRYLWFTEDVEGEQIEEILLQRINDGEDPAKVYEILADTALGKDSSGKRLAYLEAWALEAPDDPEPVQDLASALQNEGALELAIEAQQEALRRAGDSDDAVYAAERLVSMLIEAVRYEEAASIAHQFSTREEGSERGRRMLAEVAQAEGRTEDAMVLYEQILAEDPHACYMVIDFLEFLRDQGRLDEIDAIIDRCSKDDEDDEWLNNYPAQFTLSLYAQLDLFDRALALVDKYLADSPEDSSLWNHKAGYLLKLGRWGEAEAAYSEAIRLAPRDDAAYRGLAELYRMDERWNEIVALLGPLVADKSSVDAELGLELARAQAAAGSPEAALAVLERTVQENPKSFDAWYELGTVSADLDRRDRAVAAYRQFLELTTGYDPDEGGSCQCRCDVIDMRDEAEEQLSKLEARVVPQQSGRVGTR